MKQIIQDLKNGSTRLADVPAPGPQFGEVLIRSKLSLISLGTEKMLVEFGKANYLSKARQQPEKVKMVVDKIKTDGLKPTIDSVKNKLNEPLPLGYSNVGEIVEVGQGVRHFNVGDRVVSNGHHAEFVAVAENLVAQIPEAVSDEDAVFTIVGSIALQGIRLINPTFGETVVVYGLGLIGLIATQILLANGCKVLGIDLDEKKVKLASSFGAETFQLSKNVDPVHLVHELTRQKGADAVLITASAKTDSIVSHSAKFCRKRGRIVLVGVTGLNLNRSDFYEKEISFQVSCSYGPGRYDPEYEEGGIDYPIGYVRWTEQRNFEAVLSSLESGKLSFAKLITERISLSETESVYNGITNSESIAIVIMYSNKEITPQGVVPITGQQNFVPGKSIAILGAGNFVSSTLLPALKKSDSEIIKYIISAKGLSASSIASRFKIAHASTDYKRVLNDTDIGLVIIATRHHQHAEQTIMALKAGKSVFVEKPLALTEAELQNVIEAYNKNLESGLRTPITVGFNRRFSPFSVKMKSALSDWRGPIAINATMNAGYIPPDSWVHDIETGGGRIIGEACHYIDLALFLTGSPIVAVNMFGLGKSPKMTTDTAIISLHHENGSITTINYFANGSKKYPKERIEVFAGNKNMALDNFKKLSFFGFNFKDYSAKQDKGHINQFQILSERFLSGGGDLIPFAEIVNTTRVTMAAIESLQKGRRITIK